MPSFYRGENCDQGISSNFTSPLVAEGAPTSDCYAIFYPKCLSIFANECGGERGAYEMRTIVIVCESFSPPFLPLVKNWLMVELGASIQVFFNLCPGLVTYPP